MEVIKVFEKTGEPQEFFISSWYCKPSILKCLAYRYQKDFNPDLLFITCSKYGCRQFLPEFSKSFPVHDLYWESYKSSCDCLVIVFNNDNVR